MLISGCRAHLIQINICPACLPDRHHADDRIPMPPGTERNNRFLAHALFFQMFCQKITVFVQFPVGNGTFFILHSNMIGIPQGCFVENSTNRTLQKFLPLLLQFLGT